MPQRKVEIFEGEIIDPDEANLVMKNATRQVGQVFLQYGVVRETVDRHVAGGGDFFGNLRRLVGQEMADTYFGGSSAVTNLMRVLSNAREKGLGSEEEVVLKAAKEMGVDLNNNTPEGVLEQRRSVIDWLQKNS